MPVIKEAAGHGLIIRYIIDLVKGALLCIMAQKARFIDHPKISDYPDIHLPAIILYQEKKNAQEGDDPPPMMEGSRHVYFQAKRNYNPSQGNEERNHEQSPTAVGD
jgi:hypothetical protein